MNANHGNGRRRTNSSAHFVYPVFISLLLTNAEGNMYWSRFFEVFEEARDKFLKGFHQKLLQSIRVGSVIPTKMEMKHIREVFMGQILDVNLRLEGDGNHFLFKVDYLREGERVAVASQELSSFSGGEKRIPLDTQKYPYSELDQLIKCSDVGITGAVHWYQFAHWLGYQREKFITQELPNVMQLMEEGLVIITRETSIELYQPVHINNELVVRIRINRTIGLKMTELHVEFIRRTDEGEELVALGLQKLAYAKRKKDGAQETSLIPTEFLQVGERYLISKMGRTLSFLLGKMMT